MSTPLDDARALARRDVSDESLVTIAAWVKELRTTVLALADAIDRISKTEDAQRPVLVAADAWARAVSEPNGVHDAEQRLLAAVEVWRQA